MISFLAFVSIFLAFLAGFVVAQIAQRVVVPILVHLLGKKHFASPDAFDGCTLGIAGGFVMLAAPIFLRRLPWQFAISLALVFFGVSFYGLCWLWVLARGATKREWKIENDTVFHRDGRVLKPTFLGERSDYF